MSEGNEQLLKTLAIVRKASSFLEPGWDPRTRSGVVYRGTGSELDDARLPEYLETLADGDYLERVFVERISLCPNCGNHAINVHEACLSCASSNLTQFKALFHFRCGYVGPVAAFTKEKQGSRCPKCRKILADLGTDHESPGVYFRCRACMAMFQVPEVGARCLNCSARFTRGTLQDIQHVDVYSYRLTALGTAASRELRLQSVPQTEPGLSGREAIVAHVEEQIRKRAERGKNFGVIVIGLAPDGSNPIVEGFAKEVQEGIPVHLRLGRLDADHLVVVVESSSKAATNALRQKIVALQESSGAKPFRVEVVELDDISDNDSVADALGNMARIMRIHA